MAYPFAEGQPFVSRESKRLASRRRIEGNICGDNEDEDDNSQSIDPRRVDGAFKDVDEWVPGRIIKRVFDAIYAKEVADKEHDGHDSVTDI